MKIKLFTHTDLDGVSCHIIANHVFGAENVSAEYCDYKEVNQKVEEFYTSGKFHDFDKVFITDISVDEKVAEIINTWSRTEWGRTQLIDHHATALWLNKYGWAFVNVLHDTGHKACGTDLFLNRLISLNYISDRHTKDILANFAEQVRRWDTWDWKDVYGGVDYPKRLNNLLYLIGRKKFVERWTKSLFLSFNEDEALLIDTEETKIKKYIQKVGHNIVRKKICGYNAGVVFAESYISELGNDLAESNPDLDFIAIINMGGKSISFRAVKNNIDLGKAVASAYGGGGHAKAAGALFDATYGELCINKIFKVSLWTKIKRKFGRK